MTGAKFKLFCVQATRKLNTLNASYNLEYIKTKYIKANENVIDWLQAISKATSYGNYN